MHPVCWRTLPCVTPHPHAFYVAPALDARRQPLAAANGGRPPVRGLARRHRVACSVGYRVDGGGVDCLDIEAGLSGLGNRRGKLGFHRLQRARRHVSGGLAHDRLYRRIDASIWQVGGDVGILLGCCGRLLAHSVECAFVVGGNFRRSAWRRWKRLGSRSNLVRYATAACWLGGPGAGDWMFRTDSVPSSPHASPRGPDGDSAIWRRKGVRPQRAARRQMRPRY